MFETAKQPTQFELNLANLLKARFPYLSLSTWEEERALAKIRSVSADAALIRTPRETFDWSVARGLWSENGPVGECPAGDDPKGAALKLLDYIEGYDGPAVFILKDFHHYFGGEHRLVEQTVVRKLRDLYSALKNSSRPKSVIFLSPSLQLPTDLRKDVTLLEFPLPTFQELRALLDEMIVANQQSGRIAINVSAEDGERLAKTALGLTHQEAENAFALAMVKDGRLGIDDIDVILEEKQQVIRKDGVLEFVKSNLSLEDVGGLENLKRWLRKRDRSWDEVATQRYQLPAPKGVLITGVPGCGKSLVAKAISAAWHLPLLRLDVGRIFSGYVGSSEENMRRAIQMAEAIAPSILWIDEIEKGFGSVSGGNDSGTSARVFATFLTWMQEKQAHVFVVATANNISALPAEMMRKGRFDEIFFVDLPTQAERCDIFRLHLSRRLTNPAVLGDVRLDAALFEHLATLSETFAGAEIEQVIVAALFDAFAENRALTVEDLERSIRHTVPLAVTQSEQIFAIREWADVRAVAATSREKTAPQVVTQAIPKAGDAGDVAATRGGRTIDF